MSKHELIEHLMHLGYLKSPAIVQAFKKIDRKEFVLLEYEREAYENYPLPIGFHQTISQPLTVAFMLELLRPEIGDRILEVGAGSGWQTALLAEIISETSPTLVAATLRALGSVVKTGLGKPSLPVHTKKGKVFAIERIPELKEMAEENVAKYGFIKKGVVEVILGDGAKGYPAAAPFDKIITAAAAEAIPVAWKKQLKVGGRLVAPVKNSIMVLEKLSATDYNIKEHTGFSFVPLMTDGGSGGE